MTNLVLVLVAQSCPTLWYPIDWDPPGSPVHGILQAKILEWVVISFSKGSCWPGDRTQVTCTAGRFFTVWATREAHDKTRQCIKKQRHYFANKGPYSKTYGFSISHVWMWDLDHKKGWMPKNWCFWTVVLEKTLESPLDCKRSNQSILKKISPEHSLEGLMLKLKLLQFDHLIWRTYSLEKTLMLWNLWQEEKGMTENEMVGWHHWPSGYEFEQASGGGEGQESLACAVHDTAKWCKQQREWKQQEMCILVSLGFGKLNF